ncbi:Zn(2+)-responsive transcriptional regulator [Pseudoalteromonas luteoviolacea]|uniref:HTH merR-type domain-containing protein n=1 Tax=Pseudoalteromonas luteoviolacea S4054 TaxID=1129367 RepID=A0A0F6ACE4_9GAMM|nr:Zn(2+)-responsive transcriptional regulator [Pseudoalteromonas luteoviolacea]AOT06816.1 zinc-responsive transcriptional regulator [Pseudoalteromonas luteoviolacea]AOT11734.1 zinc-responsive transcriptional regulator [Pseudoalteromonas luteoviolacea]AOT16646.1 zinc-responsive transcriptional regulator [Pseudoalteromonas luteoviolacea]KKE83845.1 hypothetical protein N479_12160 [Pseudoalteromonas luteoviolacea S4054]
MFRIGQLAKLLEVSTDTLRYYEQQGILAASERSAAGYRLYDKQAVERMRFIVRAKEVGFNLKDIQELLSIKIEKQMHSCEEVKILTLQKRDWVREKIAELSMFERSLTLLADQCCGGDEPANTCSILTALEDLDDTHQ